MALRELRLLALVALLATAAFANSTGAIGGLTGAPGHDTCAACHGNGTLNPASGKMTIAVVGGSAYVPGQPLRLKITLEDSTARRWGFQLTARRSSANTQTLGTFTAGTGTFTSEGATLIGHNSSGTQNGAANSGSWEVQWNTPADNQGPVIFYAAGNAANANGTNDSGDQIFTTTLQVDPQATNELTGNRVMPQFVFGSGGGVGFVSTITFSNTRDAAAAVKVNFLTDTGEPMTVNGATSQTVNLSGKATSQIQATDAGALTQGWALIDLPDGVAASGIFRQRVPGKDQEAAVLLSKSNATEARFSYDQTGPYNTVMALVNTSANSATATIRLYDEAGALVQTIEKPVDARRKITLQFRGDAPSAQGKRGLVEVQVSGASIAVLALRFDDSGAFTSVPGAE